MKRIELFLNELSWENWIDNISYQVDSAFRNLFSCLESIYTHQQKQKGLFVFADINELKTFISVIEGFLEEPFLVVAFRKLVFENLILEDWKEKRTQPSDVNYYYLPDLIKASLAQLLNNTSVGEITERKFLYDNDNSIAYLLVNLVRSKYGEDFVIQVVRELNPNPRKLIDIEYIETKEGFEEWIKHKVNLLATIKNGKELWVQREDVFSHLIFCDCVEAQISDYSLKDPNLATSINKLSVLNAFLANKEDKTTDFSGLGLAISGESEATLNLYSKERTFLCSDGLERVFESHIKLANWRIHFYPIPNENKCWVGYIGKHLPTKKHN